MRAWRSTQSTAQHLRNSPIRRHVSTIKPGNAGIAGLLSRNEPIGNATVNGWVKSLRKQKKIAFAALQDGSTLEPLQAVLKPEQTEG